MPPNSDENSPPPSERQCSQSKCTRIIPINDTHKTCKKCREANARTKAKKRKRDLEDNGQQRRIALQPVRVTCQNSEATRPVEYIYVESDNDIDSEKPLIEERKVNYLHIQLNRAHQFNLFKDNTVIAFTDNEAMMKRLKVVCRTQEHVFFSGCYSMPVDPLISDKERVKMTAHDIWKVTGYRFR